MTVSYALFKRRMRLEATGFYFKLNNALVQRRDLSGADYFVNAGDIRQKGLELAADYFTSFKAGSFADYLQINASYTYNHFQYGNFVRGSTDFSGKTVPSVPANTFSLIADAQFKRGIYSNITYYVASRIFLNDANTAFVGSYNLLGCRLGWRKTYEKKYKLNFYAGADNLLNGQYSLGNDINAAANRFYNAAPERNYYVGVAVQWIKLPKK
jgi:iron complex outermembrane receptor protein